MIFKLLPPPPTDHIKLPPKILIHYYKTKGSNF